MCRRCCWRGTCEVTWTDIRLFSGSDDMLVLITYDVNTTDADGRRRLRMVAKKSIATTVLSVTILFQAMSLRDGKWLGTGAMRR